MSIPRFLHTPHPHLIYFCILLYTFCFTQPLGVHSYTEGEEFTHGIAVVLVVAPSSIHGSPLSASVSAVYRGCRGCGYVRCIFGCCTWFICGTIALSLVGEQQSRDGTNENSRERVVTGASGKRRRQGAQLRYFMLNTLRCSHMRGGELCANSLEKSDVYGTVSTHRKLKHGLFSSFFTGFVIGPLGPEGWLESMKRH